MRLFLTQNFSQLTLVNGIRRSGIGRDLLVSSHAGTRLPIAVIQAQGAPPQPATDLPWMPIFPPFVEVYKTRRHLWGCLLVTISSI